jgi:hypothetical protein
VRLFCSSTRCHGVSCAALESCDPADGQCKCGTSPTWSTCAPGESCDSQLQACVSSVCQGVVCSNGSTCDPQDGTCKCGGAVCEAGQTCDSFTLTCVLSACPICVGGSSCEPDAGACVCGSGPSCTAGQECIDGGCSADPCALVSCPPGQICQGGDCHCGDATGPVCAAGQSCVAAIKTCQAASDSCSQVICLAGTYCSEADSLCHCGALDGPVCAATATCLVTPSIEVEPIADAGTTVGPVDAGAESVVGACVASCHAVNCGTNQICDPATGECICGGLGFTDAGADGGPQVCLPDQQCVPIGNRALGVFLCAELCDPLQSACPQFSSPAGEIQQGCYADPAAGIALCEPAGAAASGETCRVPSDCQPGLSCANNTCRQVCEVPSDVDLDAGDECGSNSAGCFQVIPTEVTDAGTAYIGACSNDAGE